ncbi:MAG: metallopeptidase TldD-related protein [bacterium]
MTGAGLRLAATVPVAIPLLWAGALSCSPFDAPVKPTSRVLLPPRTGGPSARLFAALTTTLRRAQRDLSGPGKERPLFLAAAASESRLHDAQFSLGQVVDRSRVRQQWVYGLVRVGSHRLDSASGAGHPSEAARLPFPPDALAVGRVLLPALERSHRWSVKRLSGTRTWLRKHPLTARPAAWTAARPVSSIARAPRPRRPSRRHGAALRLASAVFRHYPDIHESWVILRAATWSIHTVTSESARLYRDGEALSVGIRARTRAPDGARVELLWQWQHADPRRLPTAAALSRRAAELARLTLRLRTAPLARKEYAGPVLFEGRAAAAVLLQTVGMRLTANRSSMYSDHRVTADGLIGQPVLPTWLSVVDDPTASRWGKLTLLGGYPVDDEGTPARRVTLVSKGTLRSLLGSRQPSRSLRRSTGHGRALDQALHIRALPSNLLFLPERPLSRAGLRRRFLELLRSRKLPHGYIVRQVLHEQPRPGYRSRKIAWYLARPSLVYRVDASGRETLVRGYGAIRTVRPMAVLPPMVAMGGPPEVAHWLLGSGNWISVVSRGFILDDTRLVQAAQPMYKPPQLPPPLRAAGRP